MTKQERDITILDKDPIRTPWTRLEDSHAAPVCLTI